MILLTKQGHMRRASINLSITEKINSTLFNNLPVQSPYNPSDTDDPLQESVCSRCSCFWRPAKFHKFVRGNQKLGKRIKRTARCVHTNTHLKNPYKLPNSISCSLKPLLSCFSRCLSGCQNLLSSNVDLFTH